jgi:hypothetical protein
MTTWVLKSTIAPIRVSMDNSTKAIDRMTSVIDKHANTIDNHENRIVKIETVHEIRRCGDGN